MLSVGRHRFIRTTRDRFVTAQGSK